MIHLPEDLPVIYLHPGQIYFSNKPVLVSTVLGSCLSITMFSPKNNYGGISHCQLPFFHKDNNDESKCIDTYKYVDCTVDYMMKTFERLKIRKGDLEVKIFGGADVIGKDHGKRNVKTIGHQNILAAIHMMNKYELPVAASDTGGKVGRKIFFITNSGEIFLKRLRRYEKN